MATCQGEAFLLQQLESIKQQSHAKWVLHVSDDGSKDKTLDILEAFKARCEQATGQVHLYQGPQKGSTENFMHLVRLISDDQRVGPEDLFAFSDQDDVWLVDKLERAVDWHMIGTISDETLHKLPMLYAAKTYLVDEALRPMGWSKTPKGPMNFNAALVENILSGNTMVMNSALLHILKRIQIANSVWHDWSAYMVATGCEGKVFYDQVPCLLYRQHDQNVIGVKTEWSEQWTRVTSLLKGRYKVWTQTNLNGLKNIDTALSEEALNLFRLYQSIRMEKSVWVRLLKVRHLSLRRQNIFWQVLLYVALVVGLV
jgi:glycosyltransferase involved in cell wall biosynthesis